MSRKTKLHVVETENTYPRNDYSSAALIGLAAGAVVLSLGLKFYSKHKILATVAGAWMPSLLFAVYNKYENSRHYKQSLQLTKEQQ